MPVSKNFVDYTVLNAEDLNELVNQINTELDKKTDDNTLEPVAKSGEYEDLKHKPTIPDAQIQSDWNQVDDTQKDFIKNKPIIGTPEVNETSTTVASLTPNVFHKWGEVASLTITALGSGETGKLAEYMIEFQSGSTPTTLSLPNDITWVGGDDPAQNISANKTYQISIVNNLGVYAEF